MQTTCSCFRLSPIALIGVNVLRRLLADGQQEWKADLRSGEALLARQTSSALA